MTGSLLQELQAEFSGRCEFAYVDGSERATRDAWKVSVLPVVLVFHGGKEVARFVNLVRAEKLREVLGFLLEHGSTHPTSGPP